MIIHPTKIIKMSTINDDYIIVCNPCEEKLLAKNVGRTDNEYIPIVLYTRHGIIYRCPECWCCSGFVAPEKTILFSHNYTCSNKNKYPFEM